MQATSTSSGVDSSQTSTTASANVSGANALDSGAILQGQKSICIQHNGSIYRLQATKLGKLILTK